MTTPSVDELAGLLEEIAAWTTLDEGSDGFRVRAWRDAAKAVRRLGAAALTLDAAALRSTAGIGPASVEVIEQYRGGDRVQRLERLRQAHPPGLLELLRLPGLGPRLVSALHDVLGVTSVADLRAALDDGRITELPGVGQATVDTLRAVLEQGDGPIPLAEALEAMPAIRVAPSGGDVGAASLALDVGVLAGAARRGMDHLDEVVVVAAREATTEAPRLAVPVRVVEAEPDQLGWALVRATGPDDHVRALQSRARDLGLALDEDGLRGRDGRPVALPTEAALYRALGLHHVAPERRHLEGAVVAVDEPAPPALVTVGDIRGDLHVHTTWSGDGRSSMSAMVSAMAGRGLAYAAITDHAENLRINGLSREEMLRQRDELDRLRAPGGLRLLHGVELNIDADGDVDYDADFLAGFDWCVASVHSSFRRSSQEQTARLVRAIRNPAVTAIGHLTGRMLGRRRGIAFDPAPVFDALRDTGTALEINCSPRRLDAPAEIVAEAAARGVLFVISTDSHHVDALDNVDHGVRLARRAGLTTGQVVNTWDTERFMEWVASVRTA